MPASFHQSSSRVLEKANLNMAETAGSIRVERMENFDRYRTRGTIPSNKQAAVLTAIVLTCVALVTLALAITISSV